MKFEDLMFNAHGIFTVVSFVAFIGIVWWTYIFHRRSDFDAAANLPFADEPAVPAEEKRHG
jgi:cytochrome c oxidase cbb3-type subunit 4